MCIRDRYYSNYQRYQLMQVDKTRVILACRIIINDLLGKLYRYDYRFGYNLLLDEENRNLIYFLSELFRIIACIIE